MTRALQAIPNSPESRIFPSMMQKSFKLQFGIQSQLVIRCKKYLNVQTAQTLAYYQLGRKTAMASPENIVVLRGRDHTA
jgi:hypothetical protein